MSSPFHHTLSATNVIMGGLSCRLQKQKVVLATQNSYSLPSPETVPLRFSRFRFLSELLIHEQTGFQHSWKKCTDWALFDTALSLKNQSVFKSKYDDYLCVISDCTQLNAVLAYHCIILCKILVCLFVHFTNLDVQVLCRTIEIHENKSICKTGLNYLQYQKQRSDYWGKK